MFLLLRIAIVVGMIVYLSPARRSEPRSGERLVGLAGPALERADELSRLWGALPDPVRQQAIQNLANELRAKLGAAPQGSPHR